MEIDKAINDRIEFIHSAFAAHKSDFNAEYDELSELFQGVLGQKHAYEILECHYDERVEYIVAYHKLKNFVFGFDAVHTENQERSEYFSFPTAAEALRLVSQALAML
jgi:hypothetical protein